MRKNYIKPNAEIFDYNFQRPVSASASFSEEETIDLSLPTETWEEELN